jgi:hypothetical protein
VIYPGQVVNFPCAFRTAAGTLTNPTAVTYRLLAPGGTETAYVYGTAAEVTRTATGLYVLTVQLNTAGEWWCRAEGTGAVAAVDELVRCVVVTESHFATAVP